MLTMPPACAGTTRRLRCMTCRNCGAHKTPQWRRGPEGPSTLCNACGVRYKKGQPLICTVPTGSLPPLPGASAEEPAVPEVPVPMEAQAVPKVPAPMEAHASQEVPGESSSAALAVPVAAEPAATPEASSGGEGDRRRRYPAITDKASAGRFAQPETALLAACADEAQPREQAQPKPSAAALQSADPKRASIAASAEGPLTVKTAQQDPSAAAVLPELAAEGLQPRELAQPGLSAANEPMQGALKQPGSAPASASAREAQLGAITQAQPQQSAAAADEPMSGTVEQPGSAPASASAPHARLGNVTQAQPQPNAAAAADEPMQEACKQPEADKAYAEPCVLPGMASACAAAKGAEPFKQAQGEPCTAAVAAPCTETSERPWWACPAPADKASAEQQHAQPGSASAIPADAQAIQISQLESSAAAADEPMQQASEQPWWVCPAPAESYAR